MTRLSKQTLDGNVETLILAVLEAGPSYGYAIVKELNERAEGILQLGEGTIYPVLHRLQDKKLIAARWRLAENGRQRKYYRLINNGRKALAANRHQWQMLSAVMGKVMGSTENLLPKPQVKGATI
ncbi:MAG TPA: helix-turn-helix transcriptional regulator [Sedimentisphaerales bacterium]|nr:helix-turn-helix transcriptional regulator [Sedimentisphaerales bacterium]